MEFQKERDPFGEKVGRGSERVRWNEGRCGRGEFLKELAAVAAGGGEDGEGVKVRLSIEGKVGDEELFSVHSVVEGEVGEFEVNTDEDVVGGEVNNNGNEERKAWKGSELRIFYF